MRLRRGSPGPDRPERRAQRPAVELVRPRGCCPPRRVRCPAHPAGPPASREPQVVQDTSSRRSSGMSGSNRVRFCRTEARKSSTFWVTMPTRWRTSCRAHCWGETPPRVISPRSASYSRSSRRASVVLPLPVRPNRPSTRPGSSANETSLSTGSSSVVAKADLVKAHRQCPSRHGHLVAWERARAVWTVMFEHRR